MEQIEFQGKKYEWNPDVPLTFGNLRKDAGTDSCLRGYITAFMNVFGLSNYGVFDQGDEIEITPDRIKYAVEKDEIIPWLVEKGYLKEVVEEETYAAGQWFKRKDFPDCYYGFTRIYPGEQYELLCIDADYKLLTCENGARFTLKEINELVKSNLWKNLIPLESPPTITEQPEPAERRPEKCVHNKPPQPGKDMRWCDNYRAIINSNCRGDDWIYCDTDHWKTCSEYSVIFNLNKEK